MQRPLYADVPPHRLQFAAFRNGSEIGSCVFSFDAQGVGLHVSIAVDIVVRVLGIPVYRFTHHAEEEWRNGRLTALAASTDDNGTRHHVEAKSAPGDRIMLSADRRMQAIDGGAMPISFWQIAALAAPLLFDPVDGRVRRPKVEDLGHTALALASGTVQAHGFRMSEPDGYRREMWYAKKLLVQFVISAPDGSEVAYRLVQQS